jgi:hypothetical protein
VEQQENNNERKAKGRENNKDERINYIYICRFVTPKDHAIHTTKELLKEDYIMFRQNNIKSRLSFFFNLS